MKKLLLSLLLIAPTIGSAEELSSIFTKGTIQIGADTKTSKQYIDTRMSIGGDYNRISIWHEDDGFETLSSLFYTKYISRYWDINLGVSSVNLKGNLLPSVALTGMAPYYIETEITAIKYNKSTTLEVRLRHDFQITNNFAIYPEYWTTLSSKNADGFKKGVSDYSIIVGGLYNLRGADIFAEWYQNASFDKVDSGIRVGVDLLSLHF